MFGLEFVMFKVGRLVFLVILSVLIMVWLRWRFICGKGILMDVLSSAYLVLWMVVFYMV